ncbi:MAG: hypothetical protein ACRD2C_16200, partial [Acidimicrobiales bacterium]
PHGAPPYPGGPAPGYGPPPGYPMGGAQALPQFADPHAVGQAAARMGGGGRRVGKVPALILASILDPEDVVEIVVAGRLRGLNGVVALVGSKVVLVNDREWKPDVLVIPVGINLQVQGWQDDRYATLLFQDGEHQEVLERIPDRLLAIEFAQRARDRAASNAAG